MTTSRFTYIDFASIEGGANTVCERLPALPAVYGFFRNVRIHAALSPDGFADAIVRAIAAPAAPDRRSKVGPMHKVVLESRSDLSPFKEGHLRRLSSSPCFRAFLADIISKAVLLQCPVYVGKATSLQSRIRQHVDHMSDLAVRLRDAGLSIDECILAYVLLEDSQFSSDEPSLVLIEELISRITRPGFVSRIG